MYRQGNSPGAPALSSVRCPRCRWSSPNPRR
ncbi:hypothetical protein ACH49Z_02970 [Nocardia testacea]|uniref:Uncharacterized protein n=1 Tax=Nocardia testacea TaxID=248551 RepID=A0ABW7VTZ4_9NOCA